MWKKGQALVPSWIAFAVIGLLEHHFGRLVDYDFTAAMEDELDSIAAGNQARTDWLSGFYFGGAQGTEGSVARAGGLKKLVGVNLEEIDAREINSVAGVRRRRGPGRALRAVPGAGPRRRVAAGQPARRPAARRAHPRGRRAAVRGAAGGPLAGRRPGDRARDRGQGGPLRARTSPSSCPDAEPAAETERRPEEEAAGQAEAAHRLAVQGDVAETRRPSRTRCGCCRCPGWSAPTRQSGEEITAQNGRYGPYLKKGTDSRSLADEEQLFTVTLDEALEIYTQPKQRGRRTAAATPPLRELGADPATKKPMVIKDGRFGPYVTDGETNASLRKGDERGARSPTSAPPSCWPSAGPRPGAEAQGRRATQEGSRQTMSHRETHVSTGRSRYHGSDGTSRTDDQASARASSAFTAAATRPPSARPAAAAVARFMTWPICRGSGLLAQLGGGLLDGGSGDRGQLVVGELGWAGSGPAPRPRRAPARPARSRPAAANASADSARFLASLAMTLSTSASSSCAGLGAGDLGVADRGQGHPQGGLHQLVAGLHGGGEVGAQLLLQSAHGRAR